jgi:hypothetical protein
MISDIWLCDGGDSSSYKVNGWGGELDGRPIVNGYYSNSNNNSTPVYNSTSVYNSNNYDRNIYYEPYRPWYSQETSQGIRYEMDINGNSHYPYQPNLYNNQESHSILLGEREPTQSEINTENSLEVAWPVKYYKSPEKRSVWQYIKDDINKTRERVEASKAKNKIIQNGGWSGRDTRAWRHAEWAKKQNAFYEENKKIEWGRTIERAKRKTKNFGF